jgi:hypothetical protein
MFGLRKRDGADGSNHIRRWLLHGALSDSYGLLPVPLPHEDWVDCGLRPKASPSNELDQRRDKGNGVFPVGNTAAPQQTGAAAVMNEKLKM